MTKINYIKGDATKPITEGKKIIIHICNNIGLWGKGFVLAISEKWNLPEKEYKEWYKQRATNDFKLGATQFVKVEENIYVANMIAQEGIYKKNGIPPIRYQAVEQAINKVVEFAIKHNASVHMPRIGCGLAGGEWSEIEVILNKSLLEKNIKTYIYDFG